MGRQVPDDAASWREKWEHSIPFLALPAELRTAVYTTNSSENLNRQIRETIKTRGGFPDEQAATKLYLAIDKAQRSRKKADNRPAAIRALKIHFPDRIPDRYNVTTVTN
jgi:putative transposase